MDLDLPKVIRELGDYYQYFKYVPTTHMVYASQDLEAFRQVKLFIIHAQILLQYFIGQFGSPEVADPISE